MSNIAREYISHFLNDQGRETDSILIDAILETKTISDETRDKLEEQKKLQKYTAKNQEEALREECMSWWYNYREPTQSVVSAITSGEEIKNEKAEAFKLEKNAQIVASNSAKDANLSSLEPNTNLVDYRENFVQIGNVFYKVNAETGSCEEEPLINPLTFTIDDFTECVVISHHSGQVHTMETLRNLLEVAENIGLSRKSLAEIIKQMTLRYLPQYSSSMAFIKTPTQIYKNLVDTINFKVMQDNIKKAIQRIRRLPGENIEISLGAYEALLVESSKIENPNLTEKQALKKVEKSLIKAAGFLVEKPLQLEIENLQKLFSTKLDKKLTLPVLKNFIITYEDKPEYHLKSEKTLADNPVTLSIFHSDIDYYPSVQDNFNHFSFDVHPTDTSSSYRGYETTNHINKNNHDKSHKNSSLPAQAYNGVKHYFQNRIRNSTNFSRQPQQLKNNTNNYGNRDSQSPHRQNLNALPTPAQKPRNAVSPTPSERSSSPSRWTPSAPITSQPQRESTRFPSTSPSSSPESVKSTPKSPSFYKTKGGEFRRHDDLPDKYKNKKKNLYRRSQSGNSFSPRSPSSQRERGRPREKQIRQKFEKSNSKDRGKYTYNRPQSCKACGSRSHSRPTSLSRLANTPPSKICIYANHPVQTQPCRKCGGKLFHAESACKNAKPNSRLNSLERNNSFNPNLN